MLGSRYKNEGKDAEERDNDRWDARKRDGGRRGSDSESSRGEGSDSSDEEASRQSNRHTSERDERERDRVRKRGSERRGREPEKPRKRLEEEEDRSRKIRDERERNGHQDSDSESAGEERDRKRSVRGKQDQPKKFDDEENGALGSKMGRDNRQKNGNWENKSGSSDEEKDRKRSERREQDQPKKKLDEEEDNKVGNRKGRDRRQRNGHREYDSESSDEEKDKKRSERREKEQRRKRSDEEEEDGKERINEGRHGKRREQNRRSGHQRSDSESSGREDRQRDRGRRRRERVSRRHRYDSDGSSDSDGHRKRHSRRRSEDRTDKSRRDYEDGEVRSRREKNEIASELKQESRDGRGEEAAKPQIQSNAENANPGGDLSTLGRTGGVYIPPFKLFRMMKEIEDKSSVEYQRLTWDALRKSINGLVNKVNATNIKNIIPELLGENLIRGRGLFCRSCMKSQMASPGFTDVFAALVAVVNTKFPEIGDLLLKRIILQLKRAYKRNDKPQLIAAVKFIAHLVNQQVAHELVALELLTILLEQPTDDSVEVAVDFVKESGCILQDLCPKGLHGIFERFRGILHEGEIDKRVQFLIEGLFAVRKAKFQGHPAVRPELDLVEPEDQLTHEVSLEDEIDPEIGLDIFKQDPNFLENEKRYEELKRSILGDESEEEDGSEAGSEDDDDDDDAEEDEDDEEQQMQIKDETETNLINLRRTIYLTIMSSVDFEEAGHKLLKIKLEPGQEMELCIMLLECCSQERTYLRYYGLLGQRFCMINKVYQENFDKCFVQQYSMIHRLETNKLRNVAKFFAHLLGTDALPWHVLAYIRLTEEDTTSSSRIFIKILFQELSEHLGIKLLNERLNDPSMQDSFDSIFPKDNPRNTRFAINFFTSIGLGGITENLREYLKNMPRMIMQQQQPQSEDEPDSSSSGSDSSSAESESDSSSSSSSSSSEESDRDDRRRKRKKADSGGDRHRKRRR